MSDLRQGILQVRIVKRGKQLVIEAPTKKGTHFLPVNEKELGTDLAALPESQRHGLEVEYELENNQPVRVRRQGQSWQTPQAAAMWPARGEERQRARPEEAPFHQQRGGQPRPQPAIQHRDAPANATPAFHNPYNFIPAPPRVQTNPELADSPPVGHHRYFPDHWSGCITVRLTAETPLLIPDAAQVVTDHNDHKTYPVRMAANGKPYLAPTSIKGMLRAAYEAVTNSRMSIFHGHSDRLAYRMEAREGLRMIPARIEASQSGQLLVSLLPGTSKIQENGTPDGPMYAAWLRSYGRVHANKWRIPTHHGRQVWAYITLWQHANPKFQFWSVVDIRQGNGPRPTDTPSESRNSWVKAWPASPSRGRWVLGYVCITRQNIDRKHDERVFFVENPHSQQAQLVLQLTSVVAQAWRRLIVDYQDIHQDEVRQGQTGPPALQHSVWSRQVTGGPSERDLADGTLGYALVKETPTGGFALIGLYPVMISRELYKYPPVDLLDSSLRPAQSREELSPADRVFGWVNQKGTQAYRGNLRVGPVFCETQDAIEQFPGQGVPLAILGQPKPQQIRFYVAKDQQGTPLDSGVDKKDCYTQDQGLRGRKVYPHHAGLPDGYWDDPAQDRTQIPQGNRYQEYRRPPNQEGQDRDGQNRSVRAWVKPKTAFTFDIHVTNLSDVELGVLLWLLILPRDHYHRLGGGKPLGFGSVGLEIQGLDLRDGQNWASWYRSLTGITTRGRLIRSGSDAACAMCVDGFKIAVQQAYGNGRSFEEVPFIKAFLRAAQCFNDGLPLHYPRHSSWPNLEGENFKWFGENEKRGRYPLGALYSPDQGLPRLD